MCSLISTLCGLAGLFATFAMFVMRTDEKQPNTCPAPEELQSWFVKHAYSEENHVGFYYETAFKDVTQPRICKCVTSNKTLLSKDLLQDSFNVQVSGQVYHADLSFDLNVDTNRRGYMIGKWNSFLPMRGVSFPNYIVDVGVNPWTGKYEWVIEFQCKQGKNPFSSDWIEYYGLNFYSREYDNPETLAKMVDVARKRGLGPFLDSGSDLFVVDHTNCIQDH
jgi:hypothetical protein